MSVRHVVRARREARRAVDSWNALRAEEDVAHDDEYWQDVDLVLGRDQEDFRASFDWSFWRMTGCMALGGFVGMMGGALIAAAAEVLLRR